MHMLCLKPLCRFAIFGLAGVINAQRELIIAFFSYNAAQMVISFHTFVDLCTGAGVYGWEGAGRARARLARS